MKLAIITHVAHIPEGDTYFGYSAYVREMNLWGKYASRLLIAAPVTDEGKSKIHTKYEHSEISLKQIPAISFISPGQSIRALVLTPVITFRLWQVMRRADHIHLRCPGTIGLIGCLVQVFFPKKPKTAKYAGNWDPKAKQPLSYRIQKWLLSNGFWTRNMRVLVYGEWPGQSKNVTPFFTASYPDVKIEGIRQRTFERPFRFIFAGSLVVGKRPVYALQLLASLIARGIDCRLEFFGEGPEREALKNQIVQLGLKELVTLHGNETAEVVEQAYKNSDFLVLPSKSEGWPKVVAEAMFWGCIPVATSVSCVPWMLGFGERGLLLKLAPEEDSQMLLQQISRPEALTEMSRKAQLWSQQYTLDKFELEIQKLF